MPPLFSALIRAASSEGHKSTVVKPLQWAMALSFLSLPAFVALGAERWLLVIGVIFSSLFAVAFLGAFCYFAHKDPDALRSEKFTISKMAIERGLIGDSIQGLVTEEHLEGQSPQLAAASSDVSEPRELP